MCGVFDVSADIESGYEKALKLGGVERGTIEFAHHLKQQGHRPIIVSAGGPLVAELDAHQIQHITLNVGKKSEFSKVSITDPAERPDDRKIMEKG